MNPTSLATSLAACAVLAASASAQTYSWSPLNAATTAGDGGNTIPFWSVSATYQQVHEAPAMTKSAVLVIKGLGMRPPFGSVTGRSWDMNITLGHTTATALNASLTFAANLQSNTTMVFGSATTWPTFSWTQVSSGLAPAFTIPFSTQYIYFPSVGNLCWEWRHKNASTAAVMGMDVSDASAVANRGTVLPASGSGCTATGQSSPATASLLPVRVSSAVYVHQLDIALTNGAASASAILALGLSPTTASIGWCAPVISPLLLVGVATNPNGAFTIKQDLTPASGTPPLPVYAQFGFPDSRLPGGIGLSNVAAYQTPKFPGAHGITRLYTATAAGQELATAAIGADRGYGLCVAWLL